MRFGGSKKRNSGFGRLAIAGLLVLWFIVGHASGFRANTSMLSGTMPASTSEIVTGLVYVSSWFGAVLVAPIFATSSFLQMVLCRFSRFSRESGEG